MTNSFLYAAVLTAPKVISSSDNEIFTAINKSVSLYCLFNAATLDGATIVVWLKDRSKLSGYENDTRPVEGEDNQLISILQISVSREALGTYTCYCYYNRTMVTSDKPVRSDEAKITIHINSPAKDNAGRLAAVISVCIIYGRIILVENKSITKTSIVMSIVAGVFGLTIVVLVIVLTFVVKRKTSM